MNQTIDNKTALIILNMVSDIGPLRIKSILNHFPQPEKIFDASLEEICSVEDIGKVLANKILAAPDTVDWKKELDLVQQHKVNVITINEPEYPRLLKTIPDPPAVIYVKGELKKEDDIAIAIVGSRRTTNYGKTVAEKFAKELSKLNITVVSGLARGIDTCAHSTTVENKGRTVAVLGNGLSLCYPPENRKLVEKISSNNGAVISEFPMTYPPEKGNFPRRNRIIAGLSLGTIVVECDLKSGALITAKLALEQGKEVFAIPGSIYSRYSRGPHMLLKQGAKLVEDIEDVLQEIEPLKEYIQKESQTVSIEVPETLNSEEQTVYELLTVEPINIDSLLIKSSLSLGKISQVLLTLEMRGLVKPFPGKMYQRTGPELL